MPQPNGYRKAMRFMRHANKFGLPIVTFVDTPGAYAGRTAEELGQVCNTDWRVRRSAAIQSVQNFSCRQHWMGGVPSSVILVLPRLFRGAASQPWASTGLAAAYAVDQASCLSHNPYIPHVCVSVRIRAG